MQSAETVLGVLRERGRRGLLLDELYRQLFNGRQRGQQPDQAGQRLPSRLGPLDTVGEPRQ